MKVSKRKTAVAERKTKRCLENLLTEAQKSEKVAAEAERQRKIQRTAVEKSEKARVEAERRSVIKLTDEQKSEMTRLDAKRRRIVPLNLVLSVMTLSYA